MTSQTENQQDQTLMLSYQQGNSSAFDELYQRHKDSLMRFLIFRTGSKLIAEELFQDIWLSVINSRERYEVKAKFTTFLFRIAQYRVIDHYRDGAKRDQTFQEVETYEDFAEASPHPQQELQISQEVSKLKNLIKNLPDDQRDVFLFKIEVGLTVQEIAILTGEGVEATKSRLRYAYSKIKNGLTLVVTCLVFYCHPNAVVSQSIHRIANDNTSQQITNQTYQRHTVKRGGAHD